MYHDFDDDINIFGTISARECTGLIPVLPQSEYEWESYQELYSTELNGTGIVPDTRNGILRSKRKERTP